MWSYINNVYRGLQTASAANLRKLGWNPVLPVLLYFRPFLVCYASQLDYIRSIDLCPSNTGFSFTFQLNELLLCVLPKISSWMCYTVNCPFPTILEDDNVTCHSRSREDNGLNSMEKAVSFDAIHGSCLGKDYCFFHLLAAAATTTSARPKRWNISISQVELQMVLTPAPRAKFTATVRLWGLFCGLDRWYYSD